MSEQTVIDQMTDMGLDAPPAPLKINGKRVYFGPKKKQWYRLREIRSHIDGSFVVVGDFGDFKHGIYERVQVDWKAMAAEERQRMQERRRELEEKARQERAEAAAQAAMTAAELWASAARTGHSAYLQRKAVEPEACRWLRDGSIVVPLLRYDQPRDQALRAVQVIRPDGTKRFTKGFEKPGCCLRLGHVVVGEPILVCEGYATGLTLRMAVARRLPVVVALDAGNLRPVAELLRALYPQAPLLLCADDDWQTEGNPGRQKAHAVAKAVDDCHYTWPIFKPRERKPKDTDFNDLHLSAGLGVVQRQLRHAFYILGSEVLIHAAA